MEQSIHRALIVDDEPLIREATSRAMAAHEFCCDTASDGRQALKMYQEKRHDLVVTDLRMPKYHGHSLILELLKDKEPPSIVVLTGVANSRLVKDLFNRGVQDIIEKPVDFHVFAEKNAYASSARQLECLRWTGPNNTAQGQSTPIGVQNRNRLGTLWPLHTAGARPRIVVPSRHAGRPVRQLTSVLREVDAETKQ